MPAADELTGLLEQARERQTSDLDESARLAQQVLDTAHAQGDAVHEFEARGLLATAALLATRPQDAEPQVAAMESMLGTPLLAKRRAEAMVLRGRVALAERDYERATLILGEAADQARAVGDRGSEAKALHNRGLAALRLGRHEEAGAWLDASLQINLADGRERDAAANRHFQGVLAREQGHYGEALDLHRLVLEYGRRSGDLQVVAHSANALGILSGQQFSPEQAIEYFQEAARAYAQIGDRYSESMALINVGNAHLVAERREQALEWLDHGLAVALADGSADAEALARSERAKVMIESGRPEEAETEARRAVALTETGSSHMRRAQTLGALGLVLLERGNAREARPILERALESARESGRLADVKDVLRELAKAQAANGDYANASAHLAEYAELDEQMRKEETARKLAELRVQFETEKREAELAAQTQRVALLEDQAVQQQRVRWLLALALVTSLLLIMALVGRYRARQAAERALRAQHALIAKANEDLAEAADTDALTGTRNRRHFQRVVLPRLQAAGEQGRAYALALIDADRFKAINDEHGHDAGDAALVAIVGAWRGVLGERDVLVRWGGEEFLAVLVGRDAQAAEAIIEAGLVATRSAAVEGVGAPLALSVSVGWIAGPTGAPVHAEIAEADLALLAAKAGGRDRAVQARASP